jgi:hypothetical protein
VLRVIAKTHNSPRRPLDSVNHWGGEGMGTLGVFRQVLESNGDRPGTRESMARRKRIFYPLNSHPQHTINVTLLVFLNPVL